MTDLPDFLAPHHERWLAVSRQVRTDIALFEIPIVRDPQAWLTWVAGYSRDHGCTAMAEESSRSRLYDHCRMHAFDLLDGASSCTEFCIPAWLQGDAHLNYWRLIAIAKHVATPEQLQRCRT